ncbi:MAG: arylsulfatase [Pirellulales bacterium]|nr:arylsulfatase [Pirellulales bacterium]
MLLRIGICCSWLACVVPCLAAAPPNVVLIITDDQGYGDLSCHGNPLVRTPRIDSLAAEGAEFSHFYVSPVCSPTRSSLLTGRYNYRTGIVDTFVGRSMMHADEETLAETLAAAGYRTGIFGKWHLGDNVPLRPQDQGFQEVLVHGGGGIGQPADPPGNHYQDPSLLHNGIREARQGYCTDIFTNAALQFIEQGDPRPFFVYLAYNCPHDPLEVPDEDLARFAQEDTSQARFAVPGWQSPEPYPREAMIRVYGMVERIDRNVGRVLDRLAALGQAENTIVWFLTDNGPAQPRFNAGLRGSKGTVYEGGIRVPSLVRWPARIAPHTVIADPVAHLDVAPTLAAACGAKQQGPRPVDGINLLPRLVGEQPAAVEPRLLFFQWHRGDVPERYRACTVRGPRYKLVQSGGSFQQALPAELRWELYDLADDPFELEDIAARQPELVAEMRAAYDAWFDSVRDERKFAPPRIFVGDPRENPVTLTRQDWRGPASGWTPKSQGHWEIDIREAGRYTVRVRFAPVNKPVAVRLLLGQQAWTAHVGQGAAEAVFTALEWPGGPQRLQAASGADDAHLATQYLDISRIE